MSRDFVSICEVGPRDGLQIAKTRMTTADTLATIVPLMNAGGTIGLIVATRQAMQATRRRLERVEHLKWPL